jgi:hypothetical protein
VPLSHGKAAGDGITYQREVPKYLESNDPNCALVSADAPCAGVDPTDNTNLGGSPFPPDQLDIKSSANFVASLAV